MQHAMLNHHRTTPGHGVAGLGLSVSLYPKLAQTMPENSSLKRESVERLGCGTELLRAAAPLGRLRGAPPVGYSSSTPKVSTAKCSPRKIGCLRGGARSVRRCSSLNGGTAAPTRTSRSQLPSSRLPLTDAQNDDEPFTPRPQSSEQAMWNSRVWDDTCLLRQRLGECGHGSEWIVEGVSRLHTPPATAALLP